MDRKTKKEIERFVKSRNKALFSFDRKKIERHLKKYGPEALVDAPPILFWASVCKAVCNITNAPPDAKARARDILAALGMTESMEGGTT